MGARLSVNMNDETATALQTIATAQNISYTEAVRRCIAITSYIYAERDAGRRILTDNGQGGERKELVAL